jgi:hypothetical protein
LSLTPSIRFHSFAFFNFLIAILVGGVKLSPFGTAAYCASPGYDGGEIGEMMIGRGN